MIISKVLFPGIDTLTAAIVHWGIWMLLMLQIKKLGHNGLSFTLIMEKNNSIR